MIYKNCFIGILIGGYDKKCGGMINIFIEYNILYGNDMMNMDGG